MIPKTQIIENPYEARLTCEPFTFKDGKEKRRERRKNKRKN